MESCDDGSTYGGPSLADYQRWWTKMVNQDEEQR